MKILEFKRSGIGIIAEFQVDFPTKAIGGIAFGLTTMGVRGIVVCCALAIGLVAFCCTATVIRRSPLSCRHGVTGCCCLLCRHGNMRSWLWLRHFGDRHCCLSWCNFGNTRHCHLPYHHSNAQQTQKISLKRDARQRCQQQRQATGNNQPAQQKGNRAVQHKCQHNDSNGGNDNGDGDSGDNDNEYNYVGSGGQHRRLIATAMEWMGMVRVQT
jgi:hypothetical protein